MKSMEEGKKQLLEWNRRGLIHAPDETDETFFQRCQEAAPIEQPPRSTLAQQLFDIDPDWIGVAYENKGLHIWEGGCTWTGGSQVTLQLNKAFLSREFYFGYTRDEILAHELVHAVRGAFEEPIFEEILAYQTSHSWLRRCLGPLFRSSKEVIFLITSLILYAIAALSDFFHIPLLISLTTLLAYGLMRLFTAHLSFYRARKKLTKITNRKNVLPILLRLTDREIVRFSKMKPAEITTYAQKMAKTTLRWQQIFSAYFPH